jgi:glycosyltransferase involved in cell wall biosynthesis
VHQAYSEWWTRLLRWTVHRADVLVPVSEFVGASLVAGGIEPWRVRPVLNAVDVERWVPTDRGPRVRAELGIDADAPLVVTACRLFPAKGVAELVRAFAGVRARVPGAQLLVVGRDVSPGGAYSVELEGIVAELGLADVVHFLGHRSDVPDLMDAADVFALPSLGEPFGLVYVEAMSMGVPTVALAHGGALEIIDHGETGLLAEPGDVQGLEDHLVVLLESRELRAEMGRRGRACVEARFSIRRQADDITRLYGSLPVRGAGAPDRPRTSGSA